MLSSCLASRTTKRRNPLQQQQHQQRYYLFKLTNTTQCDQRPSPDNPYKEEIERLQRELDEPCKSCLYTGIAVCTGLSLYFAKLAIEDGVPVKNQRFLWACSAGWIVAGAYRWHLG